MVWSTRRAGRAIAAVSAATMLIVLWTAAAGLLRAQPDAPDITLFFATASLDPAEADEALEAIAAGWRDGYAAILWDIARFLPSPRPGATGALAANGAVRERTVRFLEEQTGQRFGHDLEAWHDWIWRLPYDPHPAYFIFKGVWYGQIDIRFGDFFATGGPATIRLDEIDWGGVRVNGIPPLEYPAVLPVGEATYLDDGDIVFGLTIGEQARAYPKRILAWHEMALDRVGGVELTVVYCTLCGTVIPFESVVGGRHITFGTSGLLYRSNKLMFDQETKSLWSTFEGRPVVGPLVDSGLELSWRPVVTTTWGEWRGRHPETMVLSLDTGFARDYAEGAAYREYFATDELMFEVPEHDDRLPNKAEVLVLRAGDGALGQPLAVAAAFLAANPLYALDVGGARLSVLTSPDGANRVFERGDERFVRAADPDRVIDAAGRPWRLTEDALVLEADPGVRRARVPAHRAFWFGWRAQFPDTLLIGEGAVAR